MRPAERQRALDEATSAAREAGKLLRADFHRTGGPRGGGDKAEADVEAERLIRDRLTGVFPEWGFLGEELGRVPAADGAPVWLCDPNDGTRDYLVGRRGSSVSIGLVEDGVPVLGVVFAFGYPDDDGDLFAWAEGCGPLRRNGIALEVELPAALGPGHTVLVSSKGDRDPAGNLRCAAPARYRTVPSIAHRLALVAAGEAAAATSLFAPGAWDYAAGHALLRASGATLLDESGQPVRYEADGASKVRRAFAGHPELVAALAAQPWQEVGTSGPPASREVPARLARGAALADAALLARAQGALLGQVCGDSLGSLVEFQSSAAIASRYPSGPRELEDGGTWNTLAGQPTDDSEMALALARAILAGGAYDAVAAIEAYRAWYRSGPFDAGATTRAALSGYLVGDSQANGSLMRAIPLGVLAQSWSAAAAGELGRTDSRLTHPHAACRDAVGAFVVAAAHAVRTGDRGGAFEAALAWARSAGAEAAVVETLELARAAPPVCDGESQGWVLIALRNAFFELLHAESVEAGIVASVRRGGDTDTNGAIAGALLGAACGRDALPRRWRNAVLSCRTHQARARHPRPPEYWPVDCYEIAERLVLAGNAGPQS
jgi:ADP-ribosylglycohydrolase/fructose-1,6-bisphosphatase/inositol monophosphatase family enzyme